MGTTALMAASAGLSLASQYQQHQAAEAKAELQDQRHARNKAAAYSGWLENQADLAAKQAEQTRAFRQKIRDARRQERVALAQTNISASAAGLSGSGGTVEGLKNQIEYSAHQTTERMEGTYESTLRQIERERESLIHQRNQRINSVSKGVEPSDTAFFINAASTAMSSAAKTKMMAG